MLTNTAGILAVRCIVIPNADSIPANLRFDETTASDGAIMARRIYAKAMSVPEISVQFTPKSLTTNRDDMAIMYDNFQGDGSCNGNANKTDTLLVTEAAANDVSYGVHSERDNSQEFDGLKLRMSNLIGAGGNYGRPFIQILGFSNDEIPPEKVPNGLIVLGIKGLAPGGGMTNEIGYLVLVRKGAGIETEMFRLHEELCAKPFVDDRRRELAEVQGRHEGIQSTLEKPGKT